MAQVEDMGQKHDVNIGRPNTLQQPNLGSQHSVVEGLGGSIIVIEHCLKKRDLRC